MNCSRLELQSSFTGSISQSLYTTNIPESTAVKNDLIDSCFFSALCYQFADEFGLFSLGQGFRFLT